VSQTDDDDIDDDDISSVDSDVKEIHDDDDKIIKVSSTLLQVRMVCSLAVVGSAVASLSCTTPAAQDKAMATHMISHLAHHLKGAFEPWVWIVLPKFLPLVMKQHANYSDLRSFAIEALGQVVAA
jgi:hypothetical protein